MKKVVKQIDLVAGIDALVYLLIGITSLFYIFFVSAFAEWHIFISGLDFPIFVGEIILGLCLLLCTLRQILLKESIVYKYKYWLLFGLLILIKAFIGYGAYGPLAFRDAALFYYAFFALITYHCFNRSVVIQCYLPIVMVALVGWVLYLPSNWAWGYTVLGWIIVRRISNVQWRWIGYVALVLVIPYKYFVNNTARMLVAGNLCSILFIFISWGIVYWNKVRLRWNLMLLVAGIILIGTVVLVQNPKVISTFDIQGFGETYDFYNKRYLSWKGDYRLTPKVAALYNPDKNHHLSLGLLEDDLQLFDKHSIETSKKISKILNPSKDSTLINTKTSRAIPIKEIKPSIQVIKTFTHDNVSSLQQKCIAFKPKVLLVKQVSKKVNYADLILLEGPQLSGKANNAIFRVFIWQDMWDDFSRDWPPFGFDFGKPFRSKRVEVLRWGQGEWSRDGWVAAHNSYFNIIYRMGFIGLALIVIYWMFFLNMFKVFLRSKYWEGIALLSVILGWNIAANFLLIWELPYTAIPFWSLVGIAKALTDQVKHKQAYNLHTST